MVGPFIRQPVGPAVGRPAARPPARHPAIKRARPKIGEREDRRIDDNEAGSRRELWEIGQVFQELKRALRFLCDVDGLVRDQSAGRVGRARGPDEAGRGGRVSQRRQLGYAVARIRSIWRWNRGRMAHARFEDDGIVGWKGGPASRTRR